MRISLLTAWGSIALGAILIISAAVDTLSRRPADVALEPVRLTVALVLAVVGIGLVVIGVMKHRRLLRQHQQQR